MEGVKKVLSSNWTITLVSILIGGFLGVYLNGYFQVREEKAETSKAFERVIEELSNNTERLIRWDSLTKQYFECVIDMSKYVEDGSNGLIMSLVEKDELLEKHAQILEIKSFEEVSIEKKRKYYWSMALSVNISNAMFPYDGIAWYSMKNSHYLKYIDFDCIAEIEYLHQSFREAAKNKNRWFEEYLANILTVNRGKEILLYWQLEREFNKRIIQSYPEVKEKLEACY